MNAYRDTTAWIAIANVDKERRKAEQEPRPIKQKKEYEPLPPVDWHHVLASKHKKVRINRAWLFYSEMERVLKNEPREKT